MIALDIHAKVTLNKVAREVVAMLDLSKLAFSDDEKRNQRIASKIDEVRQAQDGRTKRLFDSVRHFDGAQAYIGEQVRAIEFDRRLVAMRLKEHRRSVMLGV